MLLLIALPVIVIALWLTFPRRVRMRDCRWRRNAGLDQDGKRYFVCMTCGAETWKAANASPDFCARQGD